MTNRSGVRRRRITLRGRWSLKQQPGVATMATVSAGRPRLSPEWRYSMAHTTPVPLDHSTARQLIHWAQMIDLTFNSE